MRAEKIKSLRPRMLLKKGKAKLLQKEELYRNFH